MNVLDLTAVGCGPFNLSLAALASRVSDLRFRAFDAAAGICWHPGLMLENAMMQTSFLADLVSLVDPTHPLSFLNYLAEEDRMYAFYIREEFHCRRREHEAYLKWAAARLTSLSFEHRINAVEWDEAADALALSVSDTSSGASVREQRILTRHAVLGLGTEPRVLKPFAELAPRHWLHTSQYLFRQDDLRRAPSITVVGSGQSGAEVFFDLLTRYPDKKIAWFTRTSSFAPLDYTKLVLEMTTPEYMHYFHGLAPARRDALMREQWRHYKGISSDTLAQIFDELYQRRCHRGVMPTLRFGVEIERVRAAGEGVCLTAHHADLDERFEHDSGMVILATGYQPRALDILDPIKDRLSFDAQGRPALDIGHAIEADGPLGGRLFVVHGDIHTHGAAAPDLGICAYRSASILNRVTGEPVFRLPQRTAFSQFGIGTAAPPSTISDVPPLRASASTTPRQELQP
ncbi:MAG: SidA/IucD/PvdA family monooxygenase [Myxococcota bacterium]